MAVMQLLPLIK